MLTTLASVLGSGRSVVVVTRKGITYYKDPASPLLPKRVQGGGGGGGGGRGGGGGGGGA